MADVKYRKYISENEKQKALFKILHGGKEFHYANSFQYDLNDYKTKTCS